jgi:flagellar hook-length control protein FliK
MTVRVEGKSLSAEIVTETVQARQALVDNLPQLKQQLADNGLTIEKFDVRVMDQQASFSGQTFSGQSSQQNSSQSSSSWNQPSGRRSESQRVTAGRTSGFEPIGAASYSSGAGATRTLDVQV